ncbi:unnamed protein product [Gongylonema pulchrum]|uniref:CaM_binding domain-containing protein n=1 Tax=Gongylonema pulchrum TaxID=637853 RepID=A0A183DP65_9BILA|nr:unnamed protein product [Gongylonema pulchrum]
MNFGFLLTPSCHFGLSGTGAAFLLPDGCTAGADRTPDDGWARLRRQSQHAGTASSSKNSVLCCALLSLGAALLPVLIARFGASRPLLQQLHRHFLLSEADECWLFTGMTFMSGGLARGASSSLDPGQDIKDRNLVQIFKRLHMEHDLESFDFDGSLKFQSLDTAKAHPAEKLDEERTGRTRPRKIHDYALMAKGQGVLKNLVGCLSRSCSVPAEPGENSMTSQRSLYKNHRTILSSGWRTSCAVRKRNKRLALSSKSKSVNGNGSRRMGATRSRFSTQVPVRGRIKEHFGLRANNIKQAFGLSKSVFLDESWELQFRIPDKWYKQGMKPKMKKQLREVALKHLKNAIELAKLRHPEDFVKHFADFLGPSATNESDEKLEKENEVVQKKEQLSNFRSGLSTVTSPVGVYESGDTNSSKRVRKMPRAMEGFAVGYEAQRGKRARKTVRSFPAPGEAKQSAQKIAFISGLSSGVPGLRKPIEQPVAEMIETHRPQESLESGDAEVFNECGKLEETNKNPAVGDAEAFNENGKLKEANKSLADGDAEAVSEDGKLEEACKTLADGDPEAFNEGGKLEETNSSSVDGDAEAFSENGKSEEANKNMADGNAEAFDRDGKLEEANKNSADGNAEAFNEGGKLEEANSNSADGNAEAFDEGGELEEANRNPADEDTEAFDEHGKLEINESLADGDAEAFNEDGKLEEANKSVMVRDADAFNEDGKVKEASKGLTDGVGHRNANLREKVKRRLSLQDYEVATKHVHTVRSRSCDVELSSYLATYWTESDGSRLELDCTSVFCTFKLAQKLRGVFLSA